MSFFVHDDMSCICCSIFSVIVRGCATEEITGGCNTASETGVTTCDCDEDLCNSATSHMISITTVAMIGVVYGLVRSGYVI